MHNQGPVLSHDPLPPADSIDLYTRPRVTARTSQNNSNLFSLFFSSLFTDFEEDVVAAAANGFNLLCVTCYISVYSFTHHFFYCSENAIENVGNPEVAHEAARADLRRTVANLLQEVGNLLSIRAPDGINDADADEDTDNDQEAD